MHNHEQFKWTSDNTETSLMIGMPNLLGLLWPGRTAIDQIRRVVLVSQTLWFQLLGIGLQRDARCRGTEATYSFTSQLTRHSITGFVCFTGSQVSFFASMGVRANPSCFDHRAAICRGEQVGSRNFFQMCNSRKQKRKMALAQIYATQRTLTWMFAMLGCFSCHSYV